MYVSGLERELKPKLNVEIIDTVDNFKSQKVEEEPSDVLVKVS